MSAPLALPFGLGPAQIQAENLLDLALRGLNPMFDSSHRRFCYRLRLTPAGLLQEGLSYRYTLMTLLGLCRAVEAGLCSSIDRERVYRGLHGSDAGPDSAGDLGLYIWLCAMQHPEELAEVLRTCKLDVALRDCADARECRSMELAWVLSGLAHAQITQAAGVNLREQASEICNQLTANQGPHGLFGHQSPRGLVGRIRGRIGSFADQVYPIYALSKVAEAFPALRDEALLRAIACANAICRLQGSLGQWWWHYDSVTGRVLGDYPVYAVHQDAMAPMALFALAEASGVDFDDPIFKGLNWIFGANELGLDLRDAERTLVWRSLFQGRAKTRCNELLRLAGLQTSGGNLQINYEDRPYHLGWVLYAFAGRGLTPSSRDTEVPSGLEL